MTKQSVNQSSDMASVQRISQDGLKTMAVILESRHGIHAKEIAEFFAAVHKNLGDAERCDAWGNVANMVEKREQQRLTQKPLTVVRNPQNVNNPEKTRRH